MLSHIGLPFRCEAAEGEFAPALFGAGVGISDNAGIAGVEEICEFAEANGAGDGGVDQNLALDCSRDGRRVSSTS